MILRKGPGENTVCAERQAYLAEQRAKGEEEGKKEEEGKGKGKKEDDGGIEKEVVDDEA